MAFWDYKTGKIYYTPPKKCTYYKWRGWIELDCGCSGGLQWGGESPRECNECDGMGRIFLHRKSRRLALYPGGPFKGSVTKEYLKEIIKRIK